MTKVTTGAPLYIFRSIYCALRLNGMQLPCTTLAVGEKVIDRHTIQKSRSTKTTNADGDLLSYRRVGPTTVYGMLPNATGVGPKRSWNAARASLYQNALVAAHGDQLRTALRPWQELENG